MEIRVWLFLLLIKTHCRAAQENGARANRVNIFTTAKSRFSRICSSVMPCPNSSKFTVELVSTQGRPHSKFEYKDSSNCSRDMSQKIFVKNLLFLCHFAHFAKTVITCICVLESG